jgi:hypothetical protein
MFGEKRHRNKEELVKWELTWLRFTTFTFPIILNIQPEPILEQLVAMQPMTEPTDVIFHLDYVTCLPPQRWSRQWWRLRWRLTLAALRARFWPPLPSEKTTDAGRG